MISPKAVFLKATESELSEPYRERHLTGALENIFLHKIDIYLKLQYQVLFEKDFFFKLESLISPKATFP